MSSAVIEILKPSDLIPRISELMQSHWKEVGFCDAPFSINMDFYRAASDAGCMFSVAATRGATVLGYCSVMFGRHPYADVIVASSDALYIDPAHRGSLVAGKLIKTAEAEAKRRGASGFMWHCPAGSGLETVFQRRGFRQAETVTFKEI